MEGERKRRERGRVERRKEGVGQQNEKNRGREKEGGGGGGGGSGRVRKGERKRYMYICTHVKSERGGGEKEWENECDRKTVRNKDWVEKERERDREKEGDRDMLTNSLINVYINKQYVLYERERERERVIFYAQLLEPNVKSITHWETDSPKTVFTINMTLCVLF